MSNASDRTYIGSIACGVTDGAGGDSLLTAAHVLLSGNYSPDDINDVSRGDQVKLQYEGAKSVNGVWTFGWQDGTLDIVDHFQQIHSTFRPDTFYADLKRPWELMYFLMAQLHH